MGQTVRILLLIKRYRKSQLANMVRRADGMNGLLMENPHSALVGLLVGGKGKVALKVHSLGQDSYDFDRHSWRHPAHQEVTPAPTVPRDMDRAKT
jgi:hypothetical protein